MIIITADHGQGFQNGYSSHCTPLVSCGETHVPLMIKYPYQTVGQRYNFLVSTIDLAPTILDAAGVAYPNDWFDGTSLLGLAERSQPQRIIISRRITNTPRQEVYFTATDGQYRYVRRVEGKEEKDYLFNIVNDPGEQANLLPEMAGCAEARRLKAAVENYQERTKALLSGQDIFSIPPQPGK